MSSLISIFYTGRPFQEPLSDDKRKEHQRKLVDKLNQEARERLSAKKNGYKAVK